MYEIARVNPGAFNDVTYGNNRCGAVDTHPTCCDWGYNAVPGFDPISGLGTPNYPLLLKSVMEIPFTPK